MSYDHLKTQLNASLQGFGAAKAQDNQQRQGKSLPATVSKVIGLRIVEVNFEVAAGLPRRIVPVVGFEFIRYPIQVGLKGRCVPSDARLGAMTGLGSGVPDFTLPGNLGALAFEPLGNMDWTAPIDPDALQIMANILVKADQLSFFGSPTVAQPEITGALTSVTDANAMDVLQSILDALVNLGLVTDGTT